MKSEQYTNQQISELRNALAKHGVVLPDNIKAITSGGKAVCFISENEVLKLFKTTSLPEDAAAEEGYFYQANQALENVSDVAGILKERKIKVPELIGRGQFLTPAQIGKETFHAWQIMTRLDGQHSIKMLESLRPIDLASETADTLELARVAAKLHVQVDTGSKKISDGVYLKGNKFNWDEEIAIDIKNRELLKNLKSDIELNSPPQEKPTLLHGDFHPGNVLKSPEGYSVIDWDQQQFGRPEMDVWLFMSLRPQHIEEYCREYNAVAAQPLNEILVVAYGLTAAIKSYSRHMKSLQENKGEADSASPKAVPETEDFKSQIHELAKRLYQLTGKEIYARTAQDFLPSSGPGRASTSHVGLAQKPEQVVFSDQDENVGLRPQQINAGRNAARRDLRTQQAHEPSEQKSPEVTNDSDRNSQRPVVAPRQLLLTP